MNLNTSAAFVRSFKIKYGSAGEVRIAARTLVEAVRAKGSGRCGTHPCR